MTTPSEPTDAPQTPPPPPPLQPTPPGGAVDTTFAPVPRAPRARWTNPAKRGQLIAVSLIAALVIFGLGLLGGWALTSGQHHDRRGFTSYGPGREGSGPPGAGSHGGFGPARDGHFGTRGGRQPAPSRGPSALPTPAPTVAPTG